MGLFARDTSSSKSESKVGDKPIVILGTGSIKHHKVSSYRRYEGKKEWGHYKVTKF